MSAEVVKCPYRLLVLLLVAFERSLVQHSAVVSFPLVYPSVLLLSDRTAHDSCLSGLNGSGSAHSSHLRRRGEVHAARLRPLNQDRQQINTDHVIRTRSKKDAKLEPPFLPT